MTYDVDYLSIIRRKLYDQKRKPTQSGTILEEHYIRSLKIEITKLADLISVSRKTLYKIMDGKSRITPRIAVRLAKALRTTPELWLNLQQKYDIWIAENDRSLRCENIKPLVPVAAHSNF